LIHAKRLGEILGVEKLYIKDDSVNHPTLSYKDRVVPVAATRAIELGFDTFGCASTGNLGNSVAAHAARLGLACYVFIPQDLEPGKVVGSAVAGPHVVGIDGNYDDVNRLCTQVGDRYGWAFANINLRSYYAEGAKTYGFEICEQLGWVYPQHVVSPVAGGTLLPRIGKAFKELQHIGMMSGQLPRIYAAQAAGCAPVINALENGEEYPEPVKPDTIAKSIAIGNPADGYQVLETVRRSGGTGARATDEEILEAIGLLAGTEGIFTEPAGGTTLAATINLLKADAIPKDETIVVCITGNGYKTANVMVGRQDPPTRLGRSLGEFESFISKRATAQVQS
tara:strand:- start:12928 stop:13941 length:1014 start_codon:yes stop_codon:yes gene_type:complete